MDGVRAERVLAYGELGRGLPRQITRTRVGRGVGWPEGRA
jgi:hypothetical protein